MPRADSGASQEPIGGWLTLRHWSKSRQDGTFGPDDYDVMSGERVIGRIVKARAGVPPDQPWQWSITAFAVAPHVRSYGFAETRQEAKAAFAEHWRKWLALRSG